MERRLHQAPFIHDSVQLSFSLSGWLRLNGSAVARVLHCPLAQAGVFRDLLLAAPPAVQSLITYGSLALECFFVPMSIYRMTRPFAWGSMLVMHICLIVLIDFQDLSVSMILLLVITFDPRWFLASSGVWRQLSNVQCLTQPTWTSWLPSHRQDADAALRSYRY